MRLSGDFPKFPEDRKMIDDSAGDLPLASPVEAWERLSALFESAMALPASSRATFLVQACEADTSLHAELSSLVAGADDAPLFLRAFAGDVVSPAFVAATSPADTTGDNADETEELMLTGRRIRHFEVGAPIGRGGMGIVYRGRDTMLSRDVALKFLPSERFADPTARRRLVHEARAASALDDVNVCAIYAIEETTEGGLCLVMHFCRGGTLRDRIRDGALPIETALTIVTQLASGLASAHRANIVHRDLKPANVGFTDDGVAKILDFGVAVRFGSDDALSVGVAAAGTLPYMAPELLCGESADTRADVWALGVMLHEMLIGRRPFADTSDATLIHAILHDQPSALVRSDAVGIPGGVAQLVSDMLEKERANRPADGRAVLSRLLAIATGSAPASSLEVDVPAEVRRTARRTPRTTHILMASGVALLLVVAIGIGARRVWRVRKETLVAAPLEVARTANPLPTVAVLPFAVRGGADLLYLREGMVELLAPTFDATGLVRAIDPNSSIGASQVNGGAPLDSSHARTVAERLGAQRYVVGSVVREGDGVTVRATLHHGDGADVARAQVTVARTDRLSSGVESLVRQLVAAELQAPGDTVAGLAATMTTSNRALRAYLDGERELRDARPAAAVAFFSRAVQEDSLFALAWYRLARAARWSEVDSLNARAVRRAYALSASLPLRLQQLVRAYFSLRVGSPVEAERMFRQLVLDYPTDVDAWMLLGETLFDNNQFLGRETSEAAGPFRRVMALDMRNREVTVYLMELAARANRRGELDTLFQMYFTPNSAGEQPGIRQTYLALHARREQLAEHAIDDRIGAQIALRRAGSEPSDIRAVRRFATVLAAPSNTLDTRVEGLLALATLSWSDHQAAHAQQSWSEAGKLNPGAALLHRALMMASPATASPADSLRSVRRALDASSDGAVISGELSAQEQRSVRVYLSGLLSRQLADTTALSRAQRELAGARTADRIAAPLSASLLGHLAALRGDHTAAVEAFERGIVAVPSQLRARVPALGQQVDRLAHADALRALGRSEAAARWYGSLRDGPALWSIPYLATVTDRLRPLN